MQKKSLFALLLLFNLSLAEAQLIPRDSMYDTPEIGSRAAVLIDAATGTLLYYKNPDEEIPPASLTKLVVMHLALEEVKAGRASLDAVIVPPPESWVINQPPGSSLMFLGEDQRTNLRDLLLGLAVPSGNDAAVAVALQFAPTVDEFVARMNQVAQSLGLTRTHFVEPSGISEFNMTTAREFALFSRFYLRNHPETLQDYHSVPVFAYPRVENVAEALRRRPGTIVQNNSNTLLGTFDGVDGIKTGYIDESGYNIALTAQRGETRFIAVILGAPLRGGIQIREEDGRKLLTWAFDNFKTVRPEPPDLEKARIWKGKVDYVGLSPDEVLDFTSRSYRAETLYYKTEIFDTLIAPLPIGSFVGNLIIYDDEGELHRVPLVTNEEIPAGGFFKRLFDSIRLFFRKK
jgi:D-alanyl-D-alanine carboxypeptidase (penicillin-binding protein 5/6)